jgi:hypothetical protein
MGGGLVLLQSAALWTRLIGGSFGNVAHVLALTINVPSRSQSRRDQSPVAIVACYLLWLGPMGPNRRSVPAVQQVSPH